MQRRDLRDDYEFGQSARRDLHKMHAWPFGIGARVTYLGVFAGNVITSKSLVSSTVSPWIKSLMYLFST